MPGNYFAITFLDDASTTDISAEICINDFRERLVLPTGYWSKKDYINQWCDAVKTVLAGSKSALITEMYNPVKPQYALMIWPLYKEGEKIFIRQEYLLLAEFNLERPFENKELYAVVSDRDEAEDMFERVVTIEDLRVWFKSLPG